MGASTSKNISHSVTKAIAKVSSDIIQNTKLSLDQGQVISVQDVDGDVVISGDRFTQKATINMTSLLDALSKEESQQKVLMELAQESKSITSGLNLAQFSDAQNIMNSLIDATVSLLSTISQTCSVFSHQFQNINISRVKGSVRIENDVFEQMYDLLQNCSEKAVSENRALQDLASKLEQKASATSEGLSLMWVALIAFLVVGTPLIGGTLLGVTFLKIIFPVFVAIGFVFIAIYFYNTDEEMKLTGFSTLIKNSQVCNGTTQVAGPQLGNIYRAPLGRHRSYQYLSDPRRGYPYHYPNQFYNVKSYDSVANAALACKQDPTCVAFDWKGLNISEFGVGTPITPETIFYSDVSKECKNSLDADNLHLLDVPIATSGPQPPTRDGFNGKVGDIYLDTTTSHWYQFAHDWPTGWKPMGVLSSEPFSTISWGSVNPNVSNDSAQENEIYVYFNEANPIYFHIFKYKNGWLEERKIRGPGLIPATPSIINTSGFKEEHRNKTWMLYTGIGCLVIGIVGTMYTFARKESRKESFEGCNTYPFSFEDQRNLPQKN